MLKVMNTLVPGDILGGVNMWMLLIALLWVLPWKGVALWKAARLSHKKWFIAMLILNTFGILEIVYIYFIARKYSVETEEHTEVSVEAK